jgi:hypothetical protein
MTPAKHPARLAGLLYLTVAVLGGFAHLVVRATVYEAGDSAATAANVLAHADLVRIGVVADLCQATIFVFLGMTLHRLLRHVDSDVASAMMILVAMASAIICLNMVFQFAGLLVATEEPYATAFGADGANAMVLLLFDLQHYGYLIAQIFFGLWLIPLGYLTHRSQSFPRALGLLLVVGGVSYLGGTLTEFLSPGLGKQIEAFIYTPPTIAELWMIGFLLARGVNNDQTLNPYPSDTAPAILLDAPITGQTVRTEADQTTRGNTGATEIEIYAAE